MEKELSLVSLIATLLIVLFFGIGFFGSPSAHAASASAPVSAPLGYDIYAPDSELDQADLKITHNQDQNTASLYPISIYQRINSKWELVGTVKNDTDAKLVLFKALDGKFYLGQTLEQLHYERLTNEHPQEQR